jgi:2-dehydro-3-deoxygalactonokinase
VPGVLKSGALPDVMRGEETQILGALQPGEGAGGPSWQSALICLPGTHAKWVEVEDGRIERFHTFMTGEVYAALTAHTILGRTMTRPAEPNLAAFARGVTVAREHGASGLLGTAFSSRALALTGQLAADEQPDYLSGLLIGHELAGLTAMLAERGVALRTSEPRLIGTDALCERYRVALAQFGCTNAHTVHHATERGLWRIATQAGLVTQA